MGGGVRVSVKENVVKVKGGKGELSEFVNGGMIVEVGEGEVVLKEKEEGMVDKVKEGDGLDGLYGGLIKKMVVGVCEG